MPWGLRCVISPPRPGQPACTGVRHTRSPLHEVAPACPASAQSKTHAVLATLKRAQNELSSYQRKLFKIDDHMGIAISGLTADGRVLCKYMRNECINHRQAADAARRGAQRNRGRRICFERA